jgi:hypothetical protein
MEPEGSLPRPQEPSTGPYPEPDQSSPHHPILYRINTCTYQTSMSCVGFEPMIPASEPANIYSVYSRKITKTMASQNNYKHAYEFLYTYEQELF